MGQFIIIPFLFPFQGIQWQFLVLKWRKRVIWVKRWMQFNDMLLYCYQFYKHVLHMCIQSTSAENGQHLPFISFIIYITISMRESMFILELEKKKDSKQKIHLTAFWDHWSLSVHDTVLLVSTWQRVYERIKHGARTNQWTADSPNTTGKQSYRCTMRLCYMYV